MLVKFIQIFLIGLISLQVHGQSDKGWISVPLTDLSAFKPQDGNWGIVGDVFIDRNVDIHDKIPVAQPQLQKKSKKNQPPPAPVFKNANPVTVKDGAGILLNLNDEKKRSNLISNFELGDVELELELMVPRGSNSGIYLQGRYEVQVL